MATKFELYLDESGDFNDTRPNKPHPEDLSLVGGILIDPSLVSIQRLMQIYPNKVHCSEKGFNTTYIEQMETFKNEGHRFIIFENSERLKIVSAHRTYMNIISEGLIKLFRDLAIEYPEGVDVHVVIAQRNTEEKNYLLSIQEKIYLGLGREKISNCSYTLEVADAQIDRRLYVADILCFMYLTSHRNENKFSADQQNRIEKLFSNCQKYPVFEDATVSYIKQLLLDHHYGEAMCQICALPKLTAVSKQRDALIESLLKEDRIERDIHFRQMSAMLTLCREQYHYTEGVALGNHYQEYFLDPLSSYDQIKDEVAYWQFDTDFHLLTVYDHLGNLSMIEKHLEKCNSNVGTIIQSWENINYYFDFRIREMNALMNLFRFEDIEKLSKQFTELFSATSKFFQDVNKQAGIETEIRSTSLGKAQGIRLQALINLIRRKPEFFDEAIRVSDAAIKEFTKPADLIRQWCYRSLLMVEMDKAEEALNCMKKIAELIPDGNNDYETIVKYIYRKENSLTDIYLLLYYTYVLVMLMEKEHPEAAPMARALCKDQFIEDLTDTKRSGFPWNIILWNMGKRCRLKGSNKGADYFYKAAIDASIKDKEQITVITFAVAIAAEQYLNSTNRSEEDRKQFEEQWHKANKLLYTNNVPKIGRAHV